MKQQKNIKSARFRNDLILICSVLVVAAASLIYLFFFRGEGDVVRVTVDGELYGIYSLNENLSLDIVTGENGENINSFVISDGKVYMQKASCPDGICVAHRPVFRDNESIVCLPNRVVITVVSDDNQDSPDVVA